MVEDGQTAVGTFPDSGDFAGILDDINTGGLPDEQTDDVLPPGVDEVAAGGFTKAEVLTPDAQALFPNVSDDSELRYQDNDGKFYRVSDEGVIEQIGTAAFKGAENVTWSNNSNETIIEFPDGSNIYYDLDTDTQVTLPKEYEEFDFSPTSDQIAFKFLPRDKEDAAIGVASPTGANVRAITGLGAHENRATIKWSPTGKIVASYAEFKDLNRQEVGFIGPNDEKYKGIIVHGRGLQSDYSPDGRYMLYSTYSDSSNNNPTLSLVEADGNRIGANNKDLGLAAAVKDCVFTSDSTSVYCAVPANDDLVGYGLIPGLADGIAKDIYRIDLRTGSRIKIAIPVDENGFDDYEAENLMLSSDDSQLYFKDRLTGQLVKITLE